MDNISLEKLREIRDNVQIGEINESDMNLLSNIIPIDEYIEKDEPINNSDSNDDVTSLLNEVQPKQIVLSNGHSLLDKKAGFSNVLLLSIISLVSEIVFLAMSFIVYK